MLNIQKYTYILVFSAGQNMSKAMIRYLALCIFFAPRATVNPFPDIRLHRELKKKYSTYIEGVVSLELPWQ